MSHRKESNTSILSRPSVATLIKPCANICLSFVLRMETTGRELTYLHEVPVMAGAASDALLKREKEEIKLSRIHVRSLA